MLEDTGVPAVSGSAVSQVAESVLSSDFFYDSSLTKKENLKYGTSFDFTENSLNVFLNGLNITADLESVQSKEFTLSGDYDSIIDDNTIIFATYVKI